MTHRDDLLSQARALPIQDVIERLGVERYPKERHKWRCPECATGGLHVYPHDPHTAYCFGCSRTYTPIDLAMSKLGQGVREAAQTLAALYGLTPDAPAPYIPPAPHRPAPDKRRTGARVTIAVPITPPPQKREERELDHISASEQACAHLLTRGIDPDITRQAGITLLTRERWDAMLEEAGEHAVARGLVRQDGDVLRPLLFAFPALHLLYRDHTGAVSGERFAVVGEARQLDPRKYLSPFAQQPTSLFGAELLRGHDMTQPVYLCEGEINALSLRTAGHTAISCSGSGTWQDAWCEVLRDVSQLILLTDGDAAGEGWAQRIISSLDAHQGSAWVAERLRVVSCPKGKDANDLLRAGILTDYLQHGSWSALCEAQEGVRIASALTSALAFRPPHSATREEVERDVIGFMAAAKVGHHTERLLREEGHISAWCAIHEEGLGQPHGATPFGRAMWYVRMCLSH